VLTKERTDPTTEAAGRWASIVIGLVTAAVAVGIAHLVAGSISPETSPIVTIGQASIDLTPEWLKSFAIRTFGSQDKQVLLGGIGVVLAVGAIVLGVSAARRPWVGFAGLAGLALVGVAAALSRPAASLVDALPVLAGAAAGAGMLAILLRAYRPTDSSVDVPPGSAELPQRDRTNLDRRGFFVASAAGFGVALLAGGAGRVLGRRLAADGSRASVTIPPPASSASAVGAVDLEVPGASPFFTPNDRFYRVDTALLVPAVMAEDWSLRIHGMVDRPLELTYGQLLARPLIERDITLTCVSNPVGGSYVGNARWVGVSLADLLGEAGVHPDSDQLVSRSVDGWTAGTPTAAVMDGRDALLAVSMNGETLPLAHGFPVRMIVPGLYGYVSATKWLSELELSTFDAFDPYWIERGWAEQGPIKTMSRIDTPRSLAEVAAGTVPVAGVAWAQHRGIDQVEVQVDDGPWAVSQLATQDTADTWRQWLWQWQATPGEHRVRVRATDRTGSVQTPDRAEPFPDGATGHHEIVVRVT
jgi:DMSO/TMAO reductase YedYZ molybdopterin-dependent catalytic subunit